MLAKTLKSLTSKNQEFRESFHKADPKGQEVEMKAQLDAMKRKRQKQD